MFVIKSEYGNFTTPCKNQKDDNVVYWLSINFVRGKEPIKTKTYLTPKEFWFGCYKNKEGKPVPTMWIKSWEEDTKKEPEQHEQEKGLDIKADDLPFY